MTSGPVIFSLSGSIPNFISQFAYGAPATNPSVSNDNILVVVQMSGGNDGLNTVLPYTNDVYHKARKNLGIKDRFHKLNDTLALNPGMSLGPSAAVALTVFGFYLVGTSIE